MNLKHPEKVFQALISMNDYVIDDNLDFSLAGAIAWFSSFDEDKDDSYVIYGSSGINRYCCFLDGSVKFIASSSRLGAEKAKELGFELC